MDGDRFDRWSRTLSTRRSAMRGLLGGGLASMLASVSPTGEVAAAKRCPKRKKRCRKTCIPKKHCCTAAQCGKGSGRICNRGRCQCPPATKLCGGQCRSCCANADCLPGQQCTGAGSCQPITPGALTADDEQWEPSCLTSSGPRYFETHAFSWPGGAFRATMTAPDFNAWLFLFQEADVEPLEWCLWFRNDQASSHGSPANIQLDHLKAGRYALIATNDYEGMGPHPQPGAFTLTFGPD